MTGWILLQQVTTHAGSAHAAQLDPMDLILAASPVVKLVMILLAAMSVGSWFVVGAKLFQLGRAARQSGKFLDIFWAKQEGATWTVERLETIYGHARQMATAPLARVFHAGYVELAKLSGAGEGTRRQAAHDDIESVDRALRRATTTEITALEAALPFLATTGSVAPFIGLFGTVWGVMRSFIGIGNAGNASLPAVAPGIAEALIATAIGLAAAIPAVMAYNYFVRRIRVIETELLSFQNDYLNIVRRHFLAG